jgi:YHS domain-containing protein
MKLLPWIASALLVCGLFAFSPALAADKPKDDAKKPTPINKKCPVEGGDVDPDTSIQYKGKTIGFCCAGCDEEFKKDPAKFMAIIDKELAAEKKGDGAKKDGKKDAELNAKCPVTGDDADKSITTEYKGRTIAFCCEDCVKDFKKDPEKYIKKLDKEKSSKKSDDHKDHEHAEK